MSTSPSAALFEGLSESTFLTLAQAAALLPGRRVGRHMSPRVLYHWAWRGVRGVRLKTTRIGQRHVVRVADLRDFLDEISPRSTLPEPRSIPRAQERQRARRAELARRAAEIALGLAPSKARR